MTERKPTGRKTEPGLAEKAP